MSKATTWVRWMAAAAFFLASGVASAQQSQDDTEVFSVAGGLGFMQGPDAFVMGLEGEYAFGNGFSVGPAVQFGFDDDFTLISPVVFGRYRIDLVELGAPRELSRLHPYGQAGLGFSFMDVDGSKRRGHSDDDDVEFLMNFGFGAEYDLTDEVSVGSRMLFNVLPKDLFDENFYYSWEVVTARYRF